MRTATVTGMVLSSMDIGDYDRRIVILTRERGKIAAFVRGARRPRSHLAAVCRPFYTGEFDLFESRDSYNVQSANILERFEDMTSDLEAVYYGYYFAEFVSKSTAENNDEREMLMLIYAALKALTREGIPHELVRSVFELKAMVLSGDYPGGAADHASESVRYAHDFVIGTPPSKLFSFSLKTGFAEEFTRLVDSIRKYYIHYDFPSYDILKQIVG